MGGRVIRVVPRANFNFTNVTANEDQSVTLAAGIDVAAYKEATLYVRFHDGTSLSGTPGGLDIVVVADGFTSEDPAAMNNGQPAFVTVLSVTDMTGLSANEMEVIAVPANCGSSLTIVLSFTQPQTPLANATISVSADLSLKE